MAHADQRSSRLRAHRLEKNLSQAELAERAGISKRSVERLEASATGSVKLQHLVNVACVLGCSSVLDVIDDEWLEFAPLSALAPAPERTKLDRSSGGQRPTEWSARKRRGAASS